MKTALNIYSLHETVVSAWRNRIGRRMAQASNRKRPLSEQALLQQQVLIRSQLLGSNSRIEIGSRTTEQAAKRFLVGWRLPLLHKVSLIPGFRPDIYRDLQRLPRRLDPTVSYLLQGMPEGPWQLNVVRGKPVTKRRKSATSVGVHIHAHYLSELREILGRLRDFAGRKARIYITTTLPEASIKNVHRAFGVTLNMTWIRVENSGRDITPFARSLPDEFWSHDVIFHMHTKHSSRNVEYQRWFEFLLDSLLGNARVQEDLFNPIVQQFESNPRLGVVVPSDPNMMGWSLNYIHARRLVGWRVKLPGPSKGFVFPVGTMFAARPNALKSWLEVAARTSPPAEPVARDGTYLHALERLVVVMAEHEGFEAAVSWPGVARR
jgi:hypothetical protein